jgi:mitochondrial inner membrane protein COX18
LRQSHVLPKQAVAIQTRRCFSYETAVAAVDQAITSFHDTTGLPWMLTIPVVALTVNAIFRLPFAVLAQRKRMKLAELQPLIAAWDQKHTTDLRKEWGSKIGRGVREQDEMNFEFYRRRDATVARLQKKWGLQSWTTSVSDWLLILPFFVVSDAIRRMAGVRGGIFSWVTGTKDTSALTSSVDGYSFVTPSFTRGGWLWFPDLTAADPYMMLPIINSVLMLWARWPKDPELLRLLLGLRSETDKPGKLSLAAVASRGPRDLRRKARTQLVTRRIIIFVLPILPLLASQLPAAVFVYWISQTVVGILVRMSLDKLMPPREWRRPTRHTSMFLRLPK